MRRGWFNGVHSTCLMPLYCVETAKHRRQQAGHYVIIKRRLQDRVYSVFSNNNNIAYIACKTYQNERKRGSSRARNCITPRFGEFLMYFVNRSR